MTDNKKLRIGLEVSSLINHGQDIGAGRYILNLIKGLLAIDHDNSYLLFGTHTDSRYLDLAYGMGRGLSDKRIDFRFTKVPEKCIKAQDRLRFPPIEFMGFRADVFHCMDYIIPPTFNKNIVLTVHDLAFMRFPEFNFEWFIKKYSRMVAKNIINSKKVLASSESTGRDIIKFYDTVPEKVEVVHLAASPAFKKFEPKEIDKVAVSKFGIRGPYILSVGTIEPRKDFVTLIKAYNMARDKKPGPFHKLVIAGRTGWKSEATYNEHKLSPFKDDIIFTDRISDQELAQLYNQADIFVYTSLFEGFGFPPLEAMSCGLPIICSDSSSISEVVGDAGMLVSPGDIEGFADNILNVLNDDKLIERLSIDSLKRVEKFSWEQTARKTLEVYKSIA
ncbi:MAG: glycosyltransferase family 1 protein [Candidatus Humimicrobiaceae bacterium]